MLNNLKYAISTIAVLAASASTAFAGTPAGIEMSAVVGTGLPFAEGGVLGLVAAGVIGGVWLARRKR